VNAYRRLPRWAQWTIPVVVVLAIVGAASSSSSKKTPPPAVAKTPTHARASTTTALGWRTKRKGALDTQAQVVAAGDAICRAMNGRLAPLFKRFQALKEEAEAPIQQELPPLLTKAGKALAAASGELRNLPAPTNSMPKLERLAEALNATGATYIEESAAVATGDAQTVKADEHAIVHTAAMAHDFAARYGLHDCSN
jgi:hypothetical protein